MTVMAFIIMAALVVGAAVTTGCVALGVVGRNPGEPRFHRGRHRAVRGARS